MRKKSIFLFLITMIVFTVIFSACTGKQKKLSVVSLSSGKEYTLPLKAEKEGFIPLRFRWNSPFSGFVCIRLPESKQCSKR